MCVCVCVSQVVTKTVAQCVEFYYTYKKHVKIGRNGTLLFGVSDPPESRVTEDEAEQKVSGRRPAVRRKSREGVEISFYKCLLEKFASFL